MGSFDGGMSNSTTDCVVYYVKEMTEVLARLACIKIQVRCEKEIMAAMSVSVLGDEMAGLDGVLYQSCVRTVELAED